MRAEKEIYESIAKAIVSHGWLSVGRGGWTIHYRGECAGARCESRLSGYGDTAEIIALAKTVGLPGWDSRHCDFDDVFNVAVKGPIPDFPGETSAFESGPLSSVPARKVAALYAAIGADVWGWPND